MVLAERCFIPFSGCSHVVMAKGAVWFTVSRDIEVYQCYLEGLCVHRSIYAQEESLGESVLK